MHTNNLLCHQCSLCLHPTLSILLVDMMHALDDFECSDVVYMLLVMRPCVRQCCITVVCFCTKIKCEWEKTSCYASWMCLWMRMICIACWMSCAEQGRTQPDLWIEWMFIHARCVLQDEDQDLDNCQGLHFDNFNIQTSSSLSTSRLMLSCYRLMNNALPSWVSQLCYGGNYLTTNMQALKI